MSIKKIIRIILHPIERHNEKSKVSESFHDVEIIPMTLDKGTPNKVQEFMISKVNWGTTIKIVGLICIIGFFFILPTFADNTTNDTLKSTQELLEKFLSLCSRGWIVLAILAGKLMTNDFVYGAFIHMDIYLWKIRNIMKNFANFALAGLVLFSIIKSLAGKEALDVKKVITNTLVAGILIQASWFLMGALVDISTVATASIGAFPISFLKTDAKLQNNITQTMDAIKRQRAVINLVTGGNNTVTLIPEPNIPTTAPRESILPDQNSVSGPFIYLGMGVFSFQNYLTTENTTELSNLTLGFALRFFLLFLFTIGLLLLLIANLMRVGLLRIFIIGSPFLILSQVFNVGKGGSSGLGKIFSLSNLIAITFKPVIFVAGMSLMLIVIVSMQNGIVGSGATRENNLNGVILGTSGDAISTLSVEGVSNISVNQTDILGKDVVKHGQNFFSQLIMLLLTIFLMREFIKLSLTIGGGPIEETMKRLTGLAERFAKSAPILPGGGSLTSARSVMEQNTKKMVEGMGIDKHGNFGKLDGKYFQTNQQRLSDEIGEKRFGEFPSWKEKDSKELETIAKTKDSASFFSKSQELAKTRNGGLSLNNTGRMKAFEELSMQTNGAGFEGILSVDATTEQITAYFDKPRNAKALYNALGGYPASKSQEPKNYKKLEKITFHASKQ